jgi:hypothetical protein
MIFIFFTIVHIFLVVVLTIGVIYSRNTVSSIAILASLLILLLMIRHFDGCFLTTFEGDGFPSLTEMGIAMSLKDEDAVSEKHFEEIVASNLLIIHLIGMASRLILPTNILF